jgi:subtilisin family serine protease
MARSDEPPTGKLDPRLTAIRRMWRGEMADLSALDEAAAESSRQGAAQREMVQRAERRARRMPSVFPGPRGGVVSRVLHGMGASGRVSVLIRFRGDAARLSDLGATVRSVMGDLATAEVSIAALDGLEADPDVLFVELSRPAFQTLDGSVKALGVPALRRANLPATGAGVVIGVIDVDGLDFRHPDFMRETPEGLRTRVAWLWDQRVEKLPEDRAGEVPGPWGYGVEYSAADLDGELASGEPGSVVPHWPDTGPRYVNHATHMTGIAAGNGRGSDGKYAGVAPEAEIVYVNTVDSETRGFADMSKVCDAIAYIFERAGGRPCVVNISLGDNLGPHDGTSLVERFIDAAVRAPGRAVVVAAGNSNERGMHTMGAAPDALPASLVLMVPMWTDSGETIEIWYDGRDRLDVAVIDPAGNRARAAVAPRGGESLVMRESLGGAHVTITSVVGDARNGDNVVQIMLQPAEAGGHVADGKWRIELVRSEGHERPADAREWHAWIDGNTKARWTQPSKGTCTLTTPGTSRGAITVGNYLVDCGGVASTTSGCGPTRDGRRKPDVVAPGQAIMAPRASADPGARGELYVAGFGTSQATAHVAGLCAVLFNLHGPLDAETLKALLRKNACRAGLGPEWDPVYGFGRAKAGDGRAPAVEEMPRTTRVDEAGRAPAMNSTPR